MSLNQANTVLPDRLAGFRNLHAGATILVCGCGASLQEFKHPEDFITIGVNDIGRLFDPSYLVVLNSRHQFDNNRFRYVEQSRARSIFTQLDLGIEHPNIVRIQLGEYGGTHCDDPDRLPYTRNSPYVALCLALFMGAKRIGLIGVDFTDHHFFAETGQHPLSKQLAQIDQEYARLAEMCRRRAVDVVNLSRQSRLTAFPKIDCEHWQSRAVARKFQHARKNNCSRLFFVHYRFLSCGEVFTHGLRNAARELGLVYQDAYWDDAGLPQKVRAFNPDVLFVVHGRKFVQRWGDRFCGYHSAVWLLDEPYEVDDTARWSATFGTVFLNDPMTLARHRNAHYLPVAYDPYIHRETADGKKYSVGFIGGQNQTRETFLLQLLEAEQLNYLVGGPWRAPALRRLTLAANIAAEKTAELYQQTRIVVNIFRDVHHFNQQGIQAYSLNPRIYEALACGALVVSEDRLEIKEVFPKLPVFTKPANMIADIRELLADSVEFEHIRQDCHRQLSAHSYAARLQRVLEISAGSSKERRPIREPSAKPAQVSLENWTMLGTVAESHENGVIALQMNYDRRPGVEQGLAGKQRFKTVDLSFEVKLSQDAYFIAKLHQQDSLDQKTNSYHLFSQPTQSYLAMHNRVLARFELKRDVWQSIRFQRNQNCIRLSVEHRCLTELVEPQLHSGYCFLGLKGGKVWLRNISVKEGTANAVRQTDAPQQTQAIILETARTTMPTVSIITTVYDRIDCLRACIASVQQQSYQDFEHIIVADHPPENIFTRLKQLIEQADCHKIRFTNLERRYNNWGIAPAAEGLRLARGKYVCFLSDDNAYTPQHLSNLVYLLEKDQSIGFAYSSCEYAGKRVLDSPVPSFGQIDLGQPLFRRKLFQDYLKNTLPFSKMAWDWDMIQCFMRQGVKWQHKNERSFLFRLESIINSGKKKLPSAALPASEPDISIIIPTYNCAEFLDCTLDSIAKQRYDLDKLEIIVVDDGSIDHTEQMIQYWRSQIRIEYHKLPHRGVQAARNYGAEKASGDFLLFSDADVIFEPEALASYFQALSDHQEASYAYCDYQRIGIVHSEHKAIPFDGDRLKERNYISTISLLRRQDFLGFDEKIRRLTDWDIWLNLWIKHGKIGVYIPKKLFRAWIRPHGISNDGGRMSIPHSEAVRIIKEKYQLIG